MAAVKGQNLRLFIDKIAVAAAKQCDIQIRLDVQDTSTKDDTDDWNHNDAVRLSWDCRTSGLVSVDPTRNDPASLLDRIGQEVEVQFALASGTQNSEKGDILLAGTAVIADVQITAQNRESGTYTVSLTGVNDLLFPLGVLYSSNSLRLVTSDNKILVAPVAP